MGKIVPFTNHKEHTVHIGPKRVAPNQTRDVDEDYIPEELRSGTTAESSEQEQADDPILDLLEGTVSDITKAIPGLSDKDLEKLKEAEAADQNRKGIAAAVTEEELRRADAKVKSEETPDPTAIAELLEGSVAEIKEVLPAVSSEELASLKENEEAGENREDLLAAIAEEEQRRADEETGDKQ